MTTTPEPSKGVPRIEGDPSPTIRADHNDLADWVKDHAGEWYPSTDALPDDGNWAGRQAFVGASDWPYVWKSSASGWAPLVPLEKRVGFNDITQANGIIVVRHGLGFIPNWFQITMRNSGSESVLLVADVVVWDNPATSPTSVQLRAKNTTNGTWLGNNRVAGYLTAGM